MAVGDVVNDLADVLTTARLTFQPAAGVEVVITSACDSNPADDQLVELFDGTLAARFDQLNDTFLSVKIFINNAHHLSLLNSNAGTRQMGYTGIQTK